MHETMLANTKQYDRFDVLDFYRYGGALWVALVHFTIVYLPLDNPIKERIHAGFQPLMGFFFTLSGFVIMHVYGLTLSKSADYLSYLRKRLARMYPLHLATLVLAIVSGMLSDFSIDTVFQNIILVHAWNTTTHLSFNYPSWSVSAELFVYLLFPVFLFLVNRLGVWGSWLLPLASMAAIWWVFDEFDLGQWTHATYNFGCLRAMPSFLAGIVVYRLATERFGALVVPSWVAHGSAAAAIPMMILGVSETLVLAHFVLVIFLLARCEPATPGLFSSPTARALANCSYGFYMLHAFVGFIMLSYLPRIFYLDDRWTYGLATCALIMTTAISIPLFRFFEDPARRCLGAGPGSRTQAFATARDR
jgi:peptidoglycan/LPS O-acetylase OafA/YrhL